MTSDTKSEHRALMAQIHQGVGRNVLRVQELERALKVLLPLVDLKGKSHCLDGLSDRSAQVAMNTLGQLIDSFRKSTTVDPEFDLHLKQIVDDRNNLVHHFHTTFGTRISTIEGCAQVKDKLDAQFEAITRLERAVNSLFLTIVHSLRDTTFQGTPEYADFSALCEKLSSTLRSFGFAEIPVLPDCSPRDG